MTAAAIAPPDLLATIVAAAEHSIAARAREIPIEVLDQRSQSAGRQPRGQAFARALGESPAPRIIAECKRRSPSRGILRADYDAPAHARAYETAGAAAISVLTEPTFFDGALEHLAAVRAAVGVPLLRKDFIVSEYQLAEAVAYGADAVLLIVAALNDRRLGELLKRASARGLACLVEAHDLTEISRAVDAGAQVIGVNSRNLRTLAVDTQVFDRAAAHLPGYVTAVAESGIRTRPDIERLSAAGYHAFLVGERLITQPDPGDALRTLRGGAA
jgi:indole-3-glycerol phosphate synthase